MYDAAGNRIRKTEAQKETRYHYNQKNQLLKEENTEGINYFTYDKQGGIVKEKTSSGIRKFTYNSIHQQTRIETTDGRIQENKYDAEGLRYDLIENGKRTRFIYHNGELLYEKGEETKQSKEETSYQLGAGIEAFQRNSKTFYYHQDEQLNTTLISDENAAIRNHYQYDAFGAGLEAAEALPNRIRYTGQQYDEQTGQYYLRVRYYNPVLGRFMQEDVYHGDGLNLYAYCHNNPVIYYDPSGYACGNSGQIAEDKEEVVRTPAQEYADEVRNLSSGERPNAVAVIEVPNGQIVRAYNRQGIQCDEVQNVLDILGNRNNFNRQCAEVNAVSIARNNKFDLKGASITVANVRGPNSTNGIHGTPKPPCNVCQPLLDFYGIQYRE